MTKTSSPEMRWHMRNDTHVVEFPRTGSGRMQIEMFRIHHPEFRRRHIREVLQMHPDAVPIGVAILRSTP